MGFCAAIFQASTEYRPVRWALPLPSGRAATLRLQMADERMDFEIGCALRRRWCARGMGRGGRRPRLRGPLQSCRALAVIGEVMRGRRGLDEVTTWRRLDGDQLHLVSGRLRHWRRKARCCGCGAGPRMRFRPADGKLTQRLAAALRLRQHRRRRHRPWRPFRGSDPQGRC